METCIICLGDMPIENPTKAQEDTSHPDYVDLTVDDLADVILARLPCNHTLHNSCLTAWIARANSCPTCRRNFNTVDLVSAYNGPVITTYTVENKTQALEYDDADVPPDDNEDLFQFPNCLVCEQDENDQVLLICDGCDCTYHTYCIGLESIPNGEWYCPICVDNRGHVQVPPSAPTPTPQPTRQPRTRRGRNEAQTRRRQRDGGQWNRAWQETLANLNADLTSHVFNEREEEVPRRMRQSREVQQWSRRLEVARRQGAHQRFRQAVPALLNNTKPQTQEEINAWAMFDAAERLQDVESTTKPQRGRSASKTKLMPTASGRPKRQRSASAEAPPNFDSDERKIQSANLRTNTTAVNATTLSAPERKLKRPMTRRNITLQLDCPPKGEEAATDQETDITMAQLPATPQNNMHKQSLPSLLDSLLEDINKPRPQSTLDRAQLTYFTNSALSPGESTLSSIITPAPSPPRMASPAQFERHRHKSTDTSSDGEDYVAPKQIRKTSPLRIKAFEHDTVYGGVYDVVDQDSVLKHPSPSNTLNHVPLSPDISPELKPQRYPSQARPSAKPVLIETSQLVSPENIPRHIQSHTSSASSSSSPVTQNSPIKVEIEKMVRTALKPHYVPGGISKDDFTNINRTVTKKIFSTLKDTLRIREWERKKWQKIAEEEVQKEVNSLTA